jgi:hypothetical protein
MPARNLVINYSRCSDEFSVSNYSIPPLTTREIWYVVGSFSTASPPSSYEFIDFTLWPEGCGEPTPEVETYYILYEDGDIMTTQNNIGLEYQY